MTEKTLLSILKETVSSYSILEVEGICLNPYITTYYDSPDFRFYHQHHSGLRKREKVRTRTYLSCQQSYLEMKRKGLDNQTEKERIAIEFADLNNVIVCPHFSINIAHCLNAGSQAAKPFHQNYAVNRTTIERVTIDLGLTFFNGTGKLPFPMWRWLR